MNDAPEFYAIDKVAWWTWLEEHHDTETGVWLIYDKGENRTLPWSDIVDVALCFGWVDGRANGVSETQSKLYISRRKPKSTWSKINKAKVQELIANEKMQPAGLSVIETAQRNGSWDQLNKIDNLELPTELIRSFAKHKHAKENFEAFPASAKKIILYWIYSAKRKETKMSRINQTIELASKNIRSR